MSEHGTELCPSETRLLVTAKAVSPSAHIVQIGESLGKIFENTVNYKFTFYDN